MLHVESNLNTIWVDRTTKLTFFQCILVQFQCEQVPENMGIPHPLVNLFQAAHV